MYTHTTSQGSQVKENLSLKHTYIEIHTPYSRKIWLGETLANILFKHLTKNSLISEQIDQPKGY